MMSRDSSIREPLFLDVYVIVHQFSILMFMDLGIHRGLIEAVH